MADGGTEQDGDLLIRGGISAAEFLFHLVNQFCTSRLPVLFFHKYYFYFESNPRERICLFPVDGE